MIASFVFALSVYAVNGYAAHANASSAASRRPPKRSPIEDEREHREQVERDRSRVRGGQASPTSRSSRRPRPPARRRGRRRGRTCRRARSPPRSARSSGCARAPVPPRPSGRTARASPRWGMFPYGASPSRIRSAPTTPASPTSMTPRGASRLSPTRNPRRKTAAAASTHVGQTDAKRARAPAEADPEPTGEQIREHRIDERDAAEDLSAVEECERDREAEQREQVEVPDRERPTQIGEPEQEDEAERRARRRASGASSRRTRPRVRAPSSRRPADPSTPR